MQTVVMKEWWTDPAANTGWAPMYGKTNPSTRDNLKKTLDMEKASASGEKKGMDQSYKYIKEIGIMI